MSLVAVMDAAAMDLSLRSDAPAEANLFLKSAIGCVSIDLAIPLHVSTGAKGESMVTQEEFSEATITLADAGYSMSLWRQGLHGRTVERCLGPATASDGIVSR